MSERKRMERDADFDETYPHYSWAPLVWIGLQIAKLWVRRRSARQQPNASVQAAKDKRAEPQLDRFSEDPAVE